MEICVLIFQKKSMDALFVSLCLIGLILIAYPACAADENALPTKIFQIQPEDGPRLKALLEVELSSSRDKRTTASLSSASRKIILSGANLILQDTTENIARANYLLSSEGRREFASKDKLDVGVWKINPLGSLDPNSEEARSYFSFILEMVELMLYSGDGKDAAQAEGRKLWADQERMTITVTDTPANIGKVDKEIRQSQQPSRTGGTRKIHARYARPSDIARNLETIKAASNPQAPR